jgi:hypothetical protein
VIESLSPHTFIIVENSPGGFSSEEIELEEGVFVALRGITGERGDSL